MQAKNNNQLKSTLAMVGIVIAVVQISVALPLHIASFFGFEVGLIAYSIITMSVIAQALLNPLIIYAGFGSQVKQLRNQLSLLRKEYGWPRWIWSPGYWDAQSRLNAPYAPAWLRWLGLFILPYELFILILTGYLLQRDLYADRSIGPHSLRQTTTLILFLSFFCLPTFVSMWRESRITPEQAAPL